MSAQRLRDAATRARHTPEQYPPGVGLALADWLDAEADGSWNAHAEAATRLADLILGGQS